MPINWIELGEKYTLTELEGIKQAIESLKDLHKEQHNTTEKEAYERVS